MVEKKEDRKNGRNKPEALKRPGDGSRIGKAGNGDLAKTGD